MNKSILLGCFAAYVLIFLTSCMTAQDIRSLELALNADVGTQYKGALQGSAGWKQINVSLTTIELEQSREDGCSYAILIDVKTKIIKSWRYTSTREACDLKFYKTGA